MVHLFAQLGSIGTGRVLNVSSTGAYLETRLPLRLHSLLYLEPASASLTGNRMRIAASVVRRDALGVGLEWCEPATVTSNVNARVLILSGGVIDADIVTAMSVISSARTGEESGLGSSRLR